MERDVFEVDLEEQIISTGREREETPWAEAHLFREGHNLKHHGVQVEKAVLKLLNSAH